MFESSYGEGVSAETWEFRLSQEPARLWTVLADTNRLFEALDYPRYTLTDEVDPATGLRRRIARGGQGSRSMEWVERPFEWATGQWWRMSRRYSKGPLAQLEATLYLRRSAGGGSIAQYSLSAEASGVLGRTLLGSAYLRRLGDLFVRRAEEADDFLAGRSERPFNLRPHAMTREVLAEIDQRADDAIAKMDGAVDPVFTEIVKLLKTGVEADLREIRPRALARRLGRPAHAAMEACVAAAEVDLLRRRFTPICPLCRRPAVGADTLAALEPTAYCLSDRQAFAIDLAQNVELSFRPSPDLRTVSAGVYCHAGPLSTPHVVMQQELEAGERRALPFHPPPGGYRVRIEAQNGETPGGRGVWSAPLDLTGGPAPTVLAMADGVAIGGAPPDQALVLENHSAQTLRFLLEVRAWRGDAASAASAVLTETHGRAFPQDAPSEPLPAGRAYAVAFAATAGEAMRNALGPSEAARRFTALLRSAAELARSDGGVLLRRGPEAGIGLFASVASAAAFATALRESARAVLAGRGISSSSQGARELPSFVAEGAPPPIGLAIGIDEGALVLIDTGAGADASGPGITRAEALMTQAGRGGVLVCVEAAAAPETAGMWPSEGVEIQVALADDSPPTEVVRFA